MFPVLLLAAFGLVALTRTAIVDSLRYDAMNRSPINSLFASSLANLTTIRAYKQSSGLRKQFESELLETSGRAFFTYVCSSQWLGLYIDSLSLFFTLGALLAAMLSPVSSSLSALALSSVL